MALGVESLVIGSHLWFFRDGAAITVPAAGTASKTVKPGALDPLWVKLGAIMTSGITPARGEPVEVWAPQPGRLRRTNVHRPKQDFKISVTVGEWTMLIVEAIWGCQALASNATQFNPLAGSAIKGWFKVEWIDDNDVLRFTVDTYGEMTVSDEVAIAPDKLAEVKLEILPIWSSLMTGAIH